VFESDKSKKQKWRQYYWVIGRDKARRVIMGAYRTYDEADRDGYANFQEYEVITLPTKDRTAAREMIRKRILDETHDVIETFRRFKHLEGKENNGIS
jgi:hypothetical protein